MKKDLYIFTCTVYKDTKVLNHVIKDYFTGLMKPRKYKNLLFLKKIIHGRKLIKAGDSTCRHPEDAYHTGAPSPGFWCCLMRM